MDVIILATFLYTLYNAIYWCLPLVVLCGCTVRWERRLGFEDRYRWNKHFVPRVVIKLCGAYRYVRTKLPCIRHIDENISETGHMLLEIVIDKKPTESRPGMNALLNKLDQMQFDTFSNIPPEEMKMVRENKTIQTLCTQIDTLMNTNDKIKQRLNQMNLDSRIKNMLNQFKNE